MRTTLNQTKRVVTATLLIMAIISSVGFTGEMPKGDFDPPESANVFPNLLSGELKTGFFRLVTYHISEHAVRFIDLILYNRSLTAFSALIRLFRHRSPASHHANSSFTPF